MLAAACAAVAPRRYFQTRKPTQAVEYVRQSVRLGQTERGSFVLTILAQLPPALAAPVQTTMFAELLDPLEPYERKVTRTLAIGVATARRAAEEAAINGKLVPFDTAVAQGVSANLCDALAGLGSTIPDSLVDLDFTWSRSRPVVEHLPTHVTFSNEMLPVLREASRLLRETSTAEEYEVYGVVTRLERQDPGDGRVTVTTIREDPPRQVTIALGEREYGIALEAHREGMPVTCFGTLRKEGRRFMLDGPYRFQISPLE
jgi:hypothetical protein